MLLLLLLLLVPVEPGSSGPHGHCTVEPLQVCDVWRALMRSDPIQFNEVLVNNMVSYANETSGCCPSAVRKYPDSDDPQFEELGIFQLPDRLACRRGDEDCRNVCGLNCSKLLDEDITDDIKCVSDIINYAKQHFYTQDRELKVQLNRALTFNMAVVLDDQFRTCRSSFH